MPRVVRPVEPEDDARQPRLSPGERELAPLFEEELTFLRDLGAEFARSHPHARHLGLGSHQGADPFVERLLEGVAFLTARVRLRLDAEHPRLVQHLLESLYPNFASPTPSAMVVRLDPDLTNKGIERGFPVKCGTRLRSLHAEQGSKPCEFQTAMDVRIWPLTVVDVSYLDGAPHPALHARHREVGASSLLRIRLRVEGSAHFADMGLDKLTFFIADKSIAYRLHELVLGHAVASMLVPTEGDPSRAAPARMDTIRGVGFREDEAMLPEDDRTFSGYRLVQELAALPERFLFFEVSGLAEGLRGITSREVDLDLLFSRQEPRLAPGVGPASLALNCTPAVNLFEKQLDHVELQPGTAEFYVPADRYRPKDFEIHRIEKVTGHTARGMDGARDFAPLYGRSITALGTPDGYYTIRRAPRGKTERERRAGARVEDYLGDEVYLSLVDRSGNARGQGLSRLAVTALVTNRDLPALLSAKSPLWGIVDTPFVRGVQCLVGPTRPVSRSTTGRPGWQLVAHLTQNQTSPGNHSQQAAAGLRSNLLLYGSGDAAWTNPVSGLQELRVETVPRRLPVPGRLAYGMGQLFTLKVDPDKFIGFSAFLMGSVLERYFERLASVNSFTQLAMVDLLDRPIHKWPVRSGLGEVA